MHAYVYVCACMRVYVHVYMYVYVYVYVCVYVCIYIYIRARRRVGVHMHSCRRILFIRAVQSLYYMRVCHRCLYFCGLMVLGWWVGVCLYTRVHTHKLLRSLM